MEGEEVWQAVLSGLEKTVNKQSFDTWFKPVQFLRASEDLIEIGVPNRFCLDWITEHYQALITEMIRGIANRALEIRFLVVEDSPGEPSSAPASTGAKPLVPSRPGGDADEQPHPETDTLNPKYTFENFVVGENNHFAQAASLAVAEAPAKAYNPLFIYGKVGLGKTHLLQAIGHFIKKNESAIKVKYISSEKFTNEMINSIRDDKMEKFRMAYRTVDVLLVDDIQFLIDKERTQEEFFHTFNDLYESRHQVVISSDRPPKEMIPLEERLRSRFEWGLIVDIQPPDLETRVAILRKKMEPEGINIPEEVTFYIANKIKFNIRELEGALTKIIAYSSLMKKDITLNLAREILKEILSQERGEEISVEAIQKMVAKTFNIRYEDMKIKKRNREIVFPRQVAMYLCREITDYSLPEIGKEFGKRDHTTVIHAYNKIQERIKVDAELYNKIKEIMGGLKKEGSV